jgi:hypothetical protein
MMSKEKIESVVADYKEAREVFCLFREKGNEIGMSNVLRTMRKYLEMLDAEGYPLASIN